MFIISLVWLKRRGFLFCRAVASIRLHQWTKYQGYSVFKRNVLFKNLAVIVEMFHESFLVYQIKIRVNLKRPPCLLHWANSPYINTTLHLILISIVHFKSFIILSPINYTFILSTRVYKIIHPGTFKTFSPLIH